MAQPPEFIRAQLAAHQVGELFYVTHVDNLGSIFDGGILPKNQVHPGRCRDISLPSVQDRRDEIWVPVHPDSPETPDRVRNAHDMVPLFFNPRNPMTSRLRGIADELVLVVVAPGALCDDDHLLAFTDGNLAASRTRCYCDFALLTRVPWATVRKPYWSDDDDGSRKRGAELLVYPSVPIDACARIDVPTPAVRQQIVALANCPFDPSQVIVEPYWFRW